MSKGVSDKLMDFLVEVSSYYNVRKTFAKADLPGPTVWYTEEAWVGGPALADYNWEENTIRFFGKENLTLHNFLHEFYHMIQIEWMADEYKITPKYEKDMSQFRFPEQYEYMDDFDVGAERFVKDQEEVWKDKWRKLFGGGESL